MADALIVGVLQEGFERRAVGVDAVGPMVLAEQLLRLPCMLEAPWNRKARRCHLEGARDTASLRFLKGLEEVHGDPGMRLDRLALQRDDVHDRKDAGRAVVISLDRHVILEQPRDVRVSVLETIGRMRRQYRVDLTLDQHPAQALCRRRCQANAGRQIERYLFAAAGLVDARLNPLDAGKVDTVLINEEAKRRNRRSLRPFRQADPFAGEILWRADGAIAANIDRRVAEDA